MLIDDETRQAILDNDETDRQMLGNFIEGLCNMKTMAIILGRAVQILSMRMLIIDPEFATAITAEVNKAFKEYGITEGERG